MWLFFAMMEGYDLRCKLETLDDVANLLEAWWLLSGSFGSAHEIIGAHLVSLLVHLPWVRAGSSSGEGVRSAGVRCLNKCGCRLDSPLLRDVRAFPVRQERPGMMATQGRNRWCRVQWKR